MASELQAGDVFYRETYRPPEPATDWKYTAQRLQRITIRDFYGKPVDMILVTALNHVTGPATFNLGVEEPVWLTTERPATPAPAGGAVGPGGALRWRRRAGRPRR